jgi:aldehyde dehydrogenase (NAD+)
VVAIITPWNFPIGLPLWKLAPALLYGNAVVWKPSEQAPATAAALHEIWLDAGLPAGALGVVFGEAEAGAALVAEEGVAAVSFTGSTAVGRRIAAVAAARGAAVQLELGGKNAVLVLGDADLDLATRLIVQGATSYGGQKCSATSRVVAVDTVYDELRERLAHAFGALRVGDPLAAETDVGPLIDAAAVARAQRYLGAANSDGTTVVVGGEPIDGDGHFMRPALVDGVAPGSQLAWEELFAPVLAMIRAADLEAAIAIVNGTEYGFFTTICSSNVDALLELAPRIDSGIVKHNTVTTAADPHLPFGGWKASGNAVPEQGLAAREFFTRTQTLYFG